MSNLISLSTMTDADFYKEFGFWSNDEYKKKLVELYKLGRDSIYITKIDLDLGVHLALVYTHDSDEPQPVSLDILDLNRDIAYDAAAHLTFAFNLPFTTGNAPYIPVNTL